MKNLQILPTRWQNQYFLSYRQSLLTHSSVFSEKLVYKDEETEVLDNKGKTDLNKTPIWEHSKVQYSVFYHTQ